MILFYLDVTEIRVVTSKVVEQGGHQDLEEGRISVGRHVFGGQVSNKGLSEDRLSMPGQQDLDLVATRRWGRIEAGGHQHVDGLARMRLEWRKFN